MFTLTKEQAQSIADQHNAYVKSEFQITADKVDVLFHDNFDRDMEENYQATFEIPGRETVSGNPVEITIYENEVTRG